MSGPNNPNQMHPDDSRNLMIFMVISVLLWLAYDSFILKPQKEALRATQQQAELALGAEDVAAPGAPASAQSAAEIIERKQALQNIKRITVDNGQISGSISLKGARLDDVVLDEYFKTMDKKERVELLSPAGTAFPRYVDFGWVSEDKAAPLPDSSSYWQVRGNAELKPGHPVTLTWDNGQGLRFARTYSIDDQYVIAVEQKVTNTSGKSVTLYPYGLISQKGLPPHLENRYLMHEGPMGYMDGEVMELKYKKLRKEPRQEFTDTQGWLGVTDKYWLTALIPPQGQNVKYRFNYIGTPPAKGQSDTGRYQSDFTGAGLTLAPGQSGEVTSHIFSGAKKVIALKDYSKALGAKNLDLAVDFGMFWFFTMPFFYALHFIGGFVGNMGVAIIILTLLIRAAASPLTYTSYKSFANMKKVTPEVTALREKYGEDKQKLQEELIKLYQKHGVNPMAGCLPMILQIPIFFAFYKILFITLEVRHAPFVGWIQDLSAPDPTSVFNLFGLIPWDPPSFLHIGVWPCLMLAAMLLQRKLNPPPQDQLQRDMALYFPFMMTFIMAKFASGLVIYWTISAFFGVAQQIWIMRSMDVPIHLFGETHEEEELDKSVKKGPAVHPLIEMAEDEVEDALFGGDDDSSKKPVSKPKPKKSKKKKK